jgi:asparagine synthase (glutamine-hydrolysing)
MAVTNSCGVMMHSRTLGTAGPTEGYCAPFFFARNDVRDLVLLGTPKAVFGNRRTDLSTDKGIFAEWDWNGQRLTACNDRFGFFPVYLYQKQRSVGLSPSIATLIEQGADAALDYDAIAVALRFGQFVGDDSPFRHIRCLPPSARLLWQSGKLELTEQAPVRVTPADLSRIDALRIYIEKFRASVQLRLPPDERFAVPLSGGRDSRHILFELLHQGARPKFCLTYITSPEDVRVAGLICKTVGLEHRVVPESTRPYADEVLKNAVTNFGVDEGSYPLAICRDLLDQGISTIYDGIGGDVLSAGLFLTKERLGQFKYEDPVKVAEALMPLEDEVAIRRILRPDVLASCTRAMAVKRLAREIAKHAATHNPVTSFYFWNRTRRKIALTPYAMLAAIPNVISPFLDHELFDFLISLPAEIIVDHSFHTDTIRLAYPEFASIPFEDKTSPGFDRSRIHSAFADEFSAAALFKGSPSLIRPFALKSRLALSKISRSFGASQLWFLRRAAWCYQLGVLADRATGPGPP